MHTATLHRFLVDFEVDDGKLTFRHLLGNGHFIAEDVPQDKSSMSQILSTLKLKIEQ